MTFRSISLFVLYFLLLMPLEASTGYSIQPGTNVAGNTTKDSGAFIYNVTDLIIPGREEGFDITISRRYNSDYFSAPPTTIASEIGSVRVRDKTYGKLYNLKFSSWLGKGWESTIGGYLNWYEYEYLKGTTDGISGDPFTVLHMKERVETVDIQLPIGGFKFHRTFHDEDGPWKNSIKGSYAILITTEKGYTLKLPNGHHYMFTQPVQTQKLRNHWRRDHGFLGWHKAGTKTIISNNTYYLTKAHNIKTKDSLYFNYEKTPSLTDSIKVGYSAKDREKFKPGSFNFSYDVPIDAQGPNWNKAGDNSTDPDHQYASAFANLINTLDYDNYWGTIWRNLTITPCRVSSIRDSYGREVLIKYRSPLPVVDTIEELSTTGAKPFQLKEVRYTGINGTEEVISYDYHNSTALKDHLKSVTYPSNRKETYDYIDVTQIPNHKTVSQNFLLDSIKNKSGLTQTIGYMAKNEKFNQLDKFVLRYIKEEGSDKQYRWDYFFSSATSYNVHTDPDNGGKTYGFSLTQKRGAYGRTYRQYEQGLPIKYTNELGWLTEKEWSNNRRLSRTELTKGKRKLQKHFRYTYGFPKYIWTIGTNIKPSAQRFEYWHEVHENRASLFSIKRSLLKKHLLNQLKSKMTYESSDEVIIYDNPYLKTTYLYNTPGSFHFPKAIIVKHKDNYSKFSSAFKSRSINNSKLLGFTETLTLPENQQQSFTHQESSPYTHTTSFDDINLQTKITRDPNTGLETEIKDFNSTIQKHYYNDGRLKTIVYNPNSGTPYTETFEYNDELNQIIVTNKEGQITKTTYDEWGLPKTIEFLTSSGSKYEEHLLTHTSLKTISSKTITRWENGTSHSRKWTYNYDSLGRVKRAVDPDGAGTLMKYIDETGEQIITHKDGTQTVYTYDILDRLISVKNANGDTLKYQYDIFNNLTQMIDFQGKTWTYAFSPTGKLLKRHSPYHGEYVYEYDRNENLTAIIGPNETISYADFDSLGNPRTLDIPSTDGIDATFTYHDSIRNAKNRLASVTDRHKNTTHYTYNPEGLVTALEKKVNSANYEVQYQYNGLGQLTELTERNNNQLFSTTLYNYDNKGRPTTILRNNEQIVKYDYTNGPSSFGAPNEIQFGKNISTTYEYDPNFNRIKIQSTKKIDNPNTIIVRRGYAYNNRGNITYESQNSQTPLGHKNTLLQFHYDPLSQLTKMSLNGTPLNQYTYLADGRRKTSQSPEGAMTYSYNSGSTNNERPESASIKNLSINYNYDKQVNLTHRLYTSPDVHKEQLFKFNGFNQLTQAIDKEYLGKDVSKEVKNAYSSQVTYDFIYDHNNQKIVTKKNGDVTKISIWGIGNQKLAELDANGNIIKSYWHLPSSGERFGMAYRDNSDDTLKTAYFINDNRRNRIRILSDSGETLNSWTSGPFGFSRYVGGMINHSKYTDSPFPVRKLALQSPQPDHPLFRPIEEEGISNGFEGSTKERFKESFKEPYSFMGHDNEEEDLGLIYMINRWYDPQTATFLSTDPANSDPKNPVGPNPFVYVLNNPLKYVDPDGRLPVDQLMLNAYHRSSFGPRTVKIGSNIHKGVDFSTRASVKSIHAAAGGIVSFSGSQLDNIGKLTGYGNWVEIKHYSADGLPMYKTRYAHLKDPSSLSVGDRVLEGQSIGKMGNTGTSSGPHLHFELIPWDTKLNSWGEAMNPLVNGSYLNIGEFDTLDSTIPWKQGKTNNPLETNDRF